MADTDSRAVGAPLERQVRPCAYRLRDAEASAHYGRDVYVFFDASEFLDASRAAALVPSLEPLYALKTAPVALVDLGA